MTAPKTKKANWTRVSAANPCPICEQDSWCGISADGTAVCCMRVESQKPIGNGKGWLHKLSEAMNVPRYEKPAPKFDEAHWSEVANDCYAMGAAIREEVAVQLGVSVESLERLGVGEGFDKYRSLFFSTWPEKRPGGKVVGIVRRYGVPVTDGGGNKLTMQGSHHGLYLPRDWWTGANWLTVGGPVLVPEGGSDTAALLTIGMSAIGRPSNVAGVNMLIGALGHCERPIIILGERDRKPERVGGQGTCPKDCEGCAWCWPGRYGAKVTAERLQQSLPRKARVSWRLVPEGFKDVREWVNKFSEPTAGRLLARLATR